MIQAWVLALTLSFSRSVNLGKTLPLSDPQLSNLFNGALAKAISNFLTPPPINTHTPWKRQDIVYMDPWTCCIPGFHTPPSLPGSALWSLANEGCVQKILGLSSLSSPWLDHPPPWHQVPGRSSCFPSLPRQALFLSW